MELKVRPSFLGLLNRCPMAGDEPKTEALDLVPIGINARRQGRLGQAMHELMREHIPLGQIPTGQQIDDKAIIYAVDFRELFVLVDNCWRWWQQLSNLYPSPILEQTMGSGIIEGTPDLVSLNDGIEGRGLDWKSGFVLRDHTEQMEAYIWLLLQKHPAMQRVYWLVVNVRTGRVIPFKRTREQSDLWYQRTLKYLQERRYVVNDECDTCPRCLTCPAIKGWIAQAAESMGKQLVDHELGDPVDLLAGYETADFLGRLAERYHAATKAMLTAGGSVRYANREVRTVETKKEYLVGDVVMRILLTTYGVTAEQLCSSLKFTKTSLYSVLSEIAKANGEKVKDFVAEFYDRLRKEGGIEESVSHSIEVEHFDVENPPTP